MPLGEPTGSGEGSSEAEAGVDGVRLSVGSGAAATLAGALAERASVEALLVPPDDVESSEGRGVASGDPLDGVADGVSAGSRASAVSTRALGSASGMTDGAAALIAKAGPDAALVPVLDAASAPSVGVDEETDENGVAKAG